MVARAHNPLARPPAVTTHQRSWAHATWANMGGHTHTHTHTHTPNHTLYNAQLHTHTRTHTHTHTHPHTQTDTRSRTLHYAFKVECDLSTARINQHYCSALL